MEKMGRVGWKRMKEWNNGSLCIALAQYDVMNERLLCRDMEKNGDSTFI